MLSIAPPPTIYLHSGATDMRKSDLPPLMEPVSMNMVSLPRVRPLRNLAPEMEPLRGAGQDLHAA